MSTISPGYCQALAEGSQKRYHRSRLPAIGDGSRRYRRHLVLDDGRISEGYRPLPGNTRLGTIMHCGDIGTGQVMKPNNAIAITTYSLVLEIRDMASTYGMDINTFMDILNKSTGRSFVSNTSHAKGPATDGWHAKKMLGPVSN